MVTNPAESLGFSIHQLYKLFNPLCYEYCLKYSLFVFHTGNVLIIELFHQHFWLQQLSDGVGQQDNKTVQKKNKTIGIIILACLDLHDAKCL